MQEADRAKREAEIHAVAYRMVAEKGYAATSMLAIARSAKASNETLYRWYGDKKGLFRTMVAANAEEARNALAEAGSSDGAPLDVLRLLAPVLLAMLMSERAIVLNRAAAADETGELGAEIASAGRDTVFPLIAGLMERAIREGAVAAPSAEVGATWYICLLVGDLQIRRVIRRLDVPNEGFVSARVAEAWTAFERLAAAG